MQLSFCLLYWDAVSDSLALDGAGSESPQVKAAELGSLCCFPTLTAYSSNIMNCLHHHSGCSLSNRDCQKILLPHLSLSSCSSCSCCKSNQQSKICFYLKKKKKKSLKVTVSPGRGLSRLREVGSNLHRMGVSEARGIQDLCHWRM